MANFFRDNQDLQYYIEKGIDWESLIEVTEHQFRHDDGFADTGEAIEFYKDILDLVGEFVADQIAPHAAEIDREGVQFVDGEAQFPPRLEGIFAAIKELELHGMCLPRELGGQNCPLLLYMLNTELMARAEVSVMAHHGFHGGMAMAMLVFSIHEGSTEIDPQEVRIKKTRFAKEIEEIRRGDAWGCMDITEPDAGSDMSALRATGTCDEDGNWTVSGQKIFITSGHGKYHFVIARTETNKDPNDPFGGLDGLSMFLVPTYEEKDGERKRTVPIDRLEEKLGHHGSATCSLSFEDAPAQLIGKRGEGFRYMLMLMNNARLGVGFESIGLCEAALRLAQDYASERRSMGKSIDQHEMIADYLLEMETDLCGLRALAVHGAFHEEISQKLKVFGKYSHASDAHGDTHSLQRRQKHHQRQARRATPLLKYLAAEKAVEMARRCIQLHGGVGYTTEYGAEKLLRDALVMPIYEGTSQIQSLMAMKDTLSNIMKNPQLFVKRIAQTRWRSLSARNPLERRLARLQSISLSAQQHLIAKTATDKFRNLQDQPLASWPRSFFKNWNPKRDFAYAMLHAERLTRILADELICELLFAQAQEHPERTPLFERYIQRAETRCRFLLDEILHTGQDLLDQLHQPSQQQAAS